MPKLRIVVPSLLLAAAPLAAPAGASSPLDAGRAASGVRAVESDAAAGPASAARPIRHPLGIGFDLPRGWRSTETGFGLALAPPDLARDADGPRELAVVQLVPVPAALPSLDDPRAAAALTALLQRSLPDLRPEGGPTPVAGSASARRWAWSGTGPKGARIGAIVLGRAQDGWLLAVAAIAEEDTLARREAALDAVFRSLTLDAPQVHPRLAGTWIVETHRSASGIPSIPSDTIHFSHRQRFVLRPDGSVVSSSQMGVGGRTGGHDRPGTDVSGLVEGDAGLGRWASRGTDLYIAWRDGGVAKWQVYVQGERGRREMLLTPAGGGAKVLWTEE